jgi:sarcosine oxidase gamma subunit
VPGALTTVVGFGRVSALSTRLAASLLRTKPARIVNQQESSSAAGMAPDKWLVTKFVPNRHVERWNPSQNAETAHCLAQSQSSDGRKDVNAQVIAPHLTFWIRVGGWRRR